MEKYNEWSTQLDDERVRGTKADTVAYMDEKPSSFIDLSAKRKIKMTGIYVADRELEFSQEKECTRKVQKKEK